MQPRPLDLTVDMPHVAALLARTRAHGGQHHPGGIQWWLRELGREGFEAFVWPAASADDGHATGFSGFVMLDGNLVIVASDEGAGPPALDLIAWAEDHLAARGADSMEVALARDDSLIRALETRGYVPTGLELELMADVDGEPALPELPDGYRFGSLVDIGDDRFIEMHRAAWSDVRPSPYRRELHDAVKSMPDFDPELVAVVLAPDGAAAAYCIGWADPVSETLEIEPLGTHRGYRRRGLARAVVYEITRRAWETGMKRVLVWNEPKRNEAALRLYTSCGMTPRRELVQLTRALA